MYEFDEFRSVIKALRNPETGCPWDRVQTHETLIPCLIEETYEVIEGIRIWQDSADAENFCEELGDLLLQVVMQSQIASEEGLFTLDDVIHNVCDKMYRRHPHVFGDVVANDADSALASWEQAKGKEKGKDKIENPVDAVPVSFPALYRYQKMLKKAVKHFAYEAGLEKATSKLQELTDEVKKADADAYDTSKKQKLVAEMLKQVVEISAALDVNAEDALKEACASFGKSFNEPA
ncbi:MAG: MazG family protein [Lachnospiraceae bacterium]|nr:MazG family protein [Lachnospiraceae bacterium]